MVTLYFKARSKECLVTKRSKEVKQVSWHDSICKCVYYEWVPLSWMLCSVAISDVLIQMLMWCRCWRAGNSSE